MALGIVGVEAISWSASHACIWVVAIGTIVNAGLARSIG
jgi:hypothetical protein